jgi:hypothetical protein
VPLLVRLRPNGPYLLFMAVAAALAGGGVAPADLPGAVIAIGGGLALAVFGYPFVVSTVCRVPGAGCRVPGAGCRGRRRWDPLSADGGAVSLAGGPLGQARYRPARTQAAGAADLPGPTRRQL